jgi:hypothetical protein
VEQCQSRAAIAVAALTLRFFRLREMFTVNLHDSLCNFRVEPAFILAYWMEGEHEKALLHFDPFESGRAMAIIINWLIVILVFHLTDLVKY